MIRSKVVLGLFLMVASVSTVLAGTVSIQSILTNANGAQTTDYTGYNTGAWDATTGLGTLTYVFAGAPGSYYFDVFFDHQLSDLVFFNEYGSVLGSPATDQTWEIGDSFASNIYPNVQAGGALSNTNSLPGTNSNFDTSCDVLSDPTCNGDFAAAMGFAFVLGAGQGELITLNVSLTDPGSGLRLVGTHPQDDANPSAQSIYISGSAVACIIGENCEAAPAVPEPASVVLLGSGLAILLAVSRRRFSVHL
jgi:PEP-CTERM motif